MRIRSLLLALLAALAIHPARATTVVTFYTSQAVYVGADSKFLGPKGLHGFSCKIQHEGRVVWSASGLPVEPQGASPAGQMEIPADAIHRGTSFGHAVRILTAYTNEQLPLTRRIALEEGEPPSTLHVDLAVAGMEGGRDGTARLTIIGLGRRYFGHSDYAPIDCRPGGGPGCGDGYLFEMGHLARIQAILGQPGGDELVARLGPAAAIKYLVAEEERAEPKFVGGPISIVRVDGSGIHWINRGLCH